MNRTNKPHVLLLAEGTVSFMNKVNHQGAIKYKGMYYPFEPRKCLGGKKTFDALKEGDRIYFPLLRWYDETHLPLTHISPVKHELLTIGASEIVSEDIEVTYGLAIPELD